MKVAFVSDPFQVEPLGIAYLASTLKKRGHEVGLVLTNSIEELREIKPDVLAYSVTTGKHKRFLELNNIIKRDIPAISIFGGSHPTYFPEMADEKGVDYIIRGEADKSLPELLDDIALGRSHKKVTGFRALEQNLDRLPFPDREFLYSHSDNYNNPIKNVLTSRGCRFSCPYCFSLYLQFLYIISSLSFPSL